MTVPRCGRKNRGGTPCGQPAGWGTNHFGTGPCKLHGGKSPRLEAKAAAEQARAELEAEVRALGIPDTVDPVTGLLNEIAVTAGELQWLRQLVRAEAAASEQASDGLFYGERYVRHKRTPDGTETTTEAGPGLSVKMQTYERWKKAYAELVRIALAHDIAQAQIDIAEREAETFGALVAAALDAAGVTGDARVVALEAARGRYLARFGGTA